VVVSFHTATEIELIEERGDPESSAPATQKTYSSRGGLHSPGAR